MLLPNLFIIWEVDISTLLNHTFNVCFRSFETISQLLFFSVAPTCKPNQTRIYGVAKEEKTQISCQVDANPTDVQFRWTFNSSALSVDVAQNYIARSGTSSVVSYTPVTEQDYGTLLCYASNRIGHQRVPCVFHIIAAGKLILLWALIPGSYIATQCNVSLEQPSVPKLSAERTHFCFEKIQRNFLWYWLHNMFLISSP